MAPKRVFIESGTPRSRAPKGVIASTYSALTSPENASVVKSVAIFGVCLDILAPSTKLVACYMPCAYPCCQAAVALFASPLSEYLLPP